jgi:hypothetical protein
LFGKRLRRRPSATTVIACLALFLALGGAVYATAKGSKKISGNKIKKASIAGNRFKKDTVTGKQVKESTLATVPSAELASVFEGEKRFKLVLGFGASQALFTAGPFTFTATCLQNTTNSFAEANRDVARILISTSENHTVFDGLKEKQGEDPTKFLETTTPESERVFDEDSFETGKTHYDAESSSDGGAYSDAGTAVSFESDGVAMGENIGSPGCFFQGAAMIETR